MKSIKTQYIALKEGNMTQSQFMRNVRMALPQHISSTTLFKQAEKILINKGIISEIISPITEIDNSLVSEPVDFMEKFKSINEAKTESKKDNIDDFNTQELVAGYVLEKLDNEDLTLKEAAKLIVKNLKTDANYYTNYKLSGVRGSKPKEDGNPKRKPGFDKPTEVSKKMDNLVDDANKMTIVKEGSMSLLSLIDNESK